VFRFIDCEEWRKETKLDEILPKWDYPEKEELFKYYPQYYHKTDKVLSRLWSCRSAVITNCLPFA
jgi:hypothetical protein